MVKDLEGRLTHLDDVMALVERVLKVVENSVPAPLYYDSGMAHWGFRYGKPGVQHFCLLKALRSVSAFNASIVLARAGFVQEIAVLMRTVVEFTSQIKFVLDGCELGKSPSEQAEQHVQAFFLDYARNSAADFKRPTLRQGQVHQVIGDSLDKFVKASDSALSDFDAKKKYSNVYLTLSNYVHGRYPEAMDMFGGIPPRFHVRGMSGTPKDNENLEILECFLADISQTVRLMILCFGLVDQIKGDPEMCRLYEN
jgi:hypothetical protein